MSIEPEQHKRTPDGAEVVLAEYTELARPSSDHRDSSIRFRLVKRRTPCGKVITVLDIREYVIDEKKVMFSRKGITILPDEIHITIENLLRAQADYLNYGTNPRNRKPDLGDNQS